MSSAGPVFVTGAAGFIGQRLIRHLTAVGTDVVGWTRADGDLRDEGAVASRLSKLQPSQCFHLAGVSSRVAGESSALAADEVRMLENVARNLPTNCRLVYTGSMAEYGHSGRFDETAPCSPSTPYGFAKAAGTNQALAFRETTGRDVRVARLFGVYGPGEALPRLGPKLVSHLRAGRRVQLSDGEQIRDFVHVDDVCEALVAIASADALAGPLVNVGTGVGVRVRAVCEAVADSMDADRRLLQFGAHARRAVDEDMLVADPRRLGEITSVPPQRWHSPDQVRIIVSGWLGSAATQ